MASVVVSGLMASSRPLDSIERLQVANPSDWSLTTLDRFIPSAGVAPAMLTGNPTRALAAYTENMNVQTRSGYRGAATAGNPVVSYQTWGYGEWGTNGSWDRWESILLRLRSASNDLVIYDPTGIMEPVAGSIALRFIRYEDPGTEEPIFECGQDGSAWLRLYVDSSDILTLSWSFGGASAQTVVAADPLETDQFYFALCMWSGTDSSLIWGEVNQYGRVPAVTTITGTRDEPVGGWGSGPLVMRAQ